MWSIIARAQTRMHNLKVNLYTTFWCGGSLEYKQFGDFFFLVNYIEVYLSYKKMDPFQVYMIMNFDKCMCPCNHYLSQPADQLGHPESSQCPFASQSLPSSGTR